MSRFVNTRTAYVLFVILVCLGMAANGFAAADPTGTKVTFSPGSPTAGQTITFTATITDNGGFPQNADPGGLVYFYDGAPATGANCGTGTPLNAVGIATAPLSGNGTSTKLTVTAQYATVLAPGTYTISACYLSGNSGGLGWGNSDSGTGASAASVTVGAAASSITVNTTTPSTLGQAAALNATVTDTNSSGLAITGIIQFTDASNNNVVIGQCTTTGSTVTTSCTSAFSTSLLSAGSHTIKASYIPNTSVYSGSSDGTGKSQVVNPRGTATTVIASTGLVRTAAQVPISVGDAVNTAGAGMYAADAHTLGVTDVRSGHTATLLPNGSVLIVGGTASNGTTILAAPVTYTTSGGFATNTPAPTTGSFTAATGATATLLQNGTVLIAGGSTTGANAGATNTAAIYDPVANTVTAVGNMTHKRWKHTATLLPSGNVLITGGTDATGAVLNTAEEFTGATFTSTSIGNLGTARSGHTATLITVGANAGKVLLVGGTGATKSAELYTTTGSAAAATPILARTLHTARRLPDGLILISGGLVGGTAVASSELYDPINDTVVLVGGGDWVLNTTYAYGTIITPSVANNNAGGYSYMCTVAGTSGGTAPTFNQTPGSSMTMDNGVVWTNIGILSLTTARAEHTATSLNNGNVLLVGGVDASATTLNSAAQYTPAYDPQGSVAVVSNSGGPLIITADTVLGCTTLTLTGTGTTTCLASVTPNHVNGSASHQITSTGTPTGYIDAGTNHSGSSDGGGQALTVTKIDVSLAAVTDTKTYDGTTAATAGVFPTVGGTGALSGGDTAIQAFQDKNAALTPIKVIVPKIVNGTTDVSADYAGPFTNFTTGTINPRTLTVTATAGSATKVYDGTDSATGQTFTDDRIVSDDVVYTFASSKFPDKNVGTGRTVTVTGLAITSGVDQNNYTLAGTTASTTANITVRTLHVTGNTGTATKIYDGLLTATGQTIADDRVGGDVLTVAFASAAFADKNVGTAKAVTISGVAITGGTDQGNYTLNSVTTASATADITVRTLTVAGVAGSATKVYDGNGNAPAQTLSDNRVGGDLLTFSFTASFPDKNVGAARAVSITGITIASGADKTNYTLGNTTAATTGDITARTLNVTANAGTASRVYDATTNAPAQTISDDRVTGDVLTIAQTSAFLDKNVGTGKTVDVTAISITGGTDQGNYTLGNTTTSTTGNITALAITGHIAATNKVYDGSTAATVVRSLVGAVLGDSVTYTGGTVTFSDKNVGVGKTVTGTGLTLSGTDAGNYTVNSTATTTADITVRTLNVLGVDNKATKTYNGTTSATGQTLTDDRVTGDSLTLGFSSAFTDKNVGVGKTVNISAISISGGTDQANYVLGNTTSTALADITARTLNVTATSGTASKIYDATTAAPAQAIADNRVAGDLLTIGFAAAFVDKNAGLGKTVDVTAITISGGADQLNYTLGNTTASATADITALAITGSITASNRVYDGTNAAAIASRNLIGAVLGDSVTYTGGTATFGDKNVGAAKTVSATGLSLTGTDAGNYTVNSTATTTADITVRTLNVAGVANSANRVYDATTAAPGQTLSDDRVSGDVLTVTLTSATFIDKNIGAGKTVNIAGIAISGGTDAANYIVGSTTASTTADITALAITGSITAAGKVYDGSVAAGITGRNLAGVVTGDSVTYTGGTATFSDKNAGVGKTVTGTGLTLTGADAGNYTVNSTATTTSTIAPRTLNVSANAGTASRVYDATVAALGQTLSDDRVSGDLLTLSFTATFADKNIGLGKAVTASSIAISGGADALNYTVGNATATTIGDITPLAITGSVTANNKVFDATSTAVIATRTLTGVITGDSVTYIGGTATFADAAIGTGKVVTAIGLSITGTDAGNYTVNSTATTAANITAAALVVTPAAKTKVYGAAFSAFTSTVTGLQGSDAVTVTYASGGAAATAAVGAYDIVPSVTFTSGTASNYAITLTTATAGMTVTKAPLTVTANDITKVVGTTYTFAGTEFTVSATTPLFNGDKVSSATLTSTAGAPSSALAGSYAIVITAPTGTGLTNYTITLVNGTMHVGSAPSGVAINVQATLSGGGAAYIIAASVSPVTPAVPTGNITFTFSGGATVAPVTVAVDGSGKATTAAIVLPAPATGSSSYVITATYNGDVNFKSSVQTAPISVAASLRNTPIVPGTNTTITANVAYPGTGSPTITITGFSSTNPPPLNNVTCVVVSPLGTVAGAPTCSVTNTFPVTISSSSASAALSIKITTSTIVAGLHPAPLPSQRRLATLSALALGLPAFVFMGLAVPFGTLRRKALRGKVLGWIGLVLLIAMLLATVGCGGGFSNTTNSQPVVTAGASTPGSYTAVLYYTDATGTHALASVDFAVGQ